MFKKIRFMVANHTSPQGEKEWLPRLKSGHTEEFLDAYGPVRELITRGTMVGSIYALRNALLDMMSGGSAVHVPGLGTFTLTLGGKVEVTGGHYRGRDVHVNGIRFTPDDELLTSLHGLEVDQTPLPFSPSTAQLDIDAVLADLFATHETITRRDLEAACNHSLSKHRLSDLLGSLVATGHLIREGRGNQTRYRKGDER